MEDTINIEMAGYIRDDMNLRIHKFFTDGECWFRETLDFNGVGEGAEHLVFGPFLSAFDAFRDIAI